MRTKLNISEKLTSKMHAGMLVLTFCVLGHITTVEAVRSKHVPYDVATTVLHMTKWCFDKAQALILQQSYPVEELKNVNYTCAAQGTGPDPTFVWTIRNPNTNAVIETLTNLATVPEVDTDSTDGEAKSFLEFNLTTARVNQSVWCGAIDAGAVTPNYEISTLIELTPNIALGQSCSGVIDCIPNAECDSTSQTCQCRYGYYNNNGNCAAQSSLGGACSTAYPTASCFPTNSQCNSNTALCTCISGYVPSGNVCIQETSAGLGSSCTGNPPPSCVITYSSCIGGICQCDSGFYQSGSQTCSLTSTVGQTCNSAINASCSTTGSYCSSTTNRCECPSGKVYTSTSNSCDTPVLGQACTVAVGCRSAAGLTVPTCTNNVCQCPNLYYSFNGECYVQSGVGSTCNRQVLTSCSDSNSQCVGTGTTGTCTCNTGYTNNGNNVCVVVTGSTNCPANTQSPRSTEGSSTIPTPRVTVQATCYEVQLQGTVTLICQDTRKARPLTGARWYKTPGNQLIVPSTGRYINGDFLNQNLTISNANASDDAFFRCELCYNTNDCTLGPAIEVIVNGTAISSVSISATDATPVAGSQVTLSCATVPDGVATSFEWLNNGVSVGNTSTIVFDSIGAGNSGTYVCVAANDFSTVQSTNQISVDVQYAPTFSLPDGGSTISVFGDFNNGPITITCSMDANPAITLYRFYDSLNRLLGISSINTFQVTSTNAGYGTYSCTAENSIGVSNSLFFNVQLQQAAPSTGASTEDDGISTGTIAAIVIGIIFFILLIIIIIICCCNYGWCRKKEKIQIEPVIVEQPKVKPYIPRSVMSATSSTVSRQDVGVVVNGHTHVVSEEPEPVYMSPRYYLRPATDAGPIISMYDNSHEQPRAHQLPALDTQYLYTDEEPKRRHKKRRRKKHRRSYREEERPIEESPPPPPVNDDEDLIVVPGRQNENYFE